MNEYVVRICLYIKITWFYVHVPVCNVIRGLEWKLTDVTREENIGGEGKGIFMEHRLRTRHWAWLFIHLILIAKFQ